MYRNKKIGIVIPAYNEEHFIEDAIKNIPDFVDRVVVVDDGSKDNTFQIAVSIAKQNGAVKVVAHEHNRGVGAAIITGYQKCLEMDIDIIAIMAGDGDMDPTCLTSIISPITEHKADYVKGNRVAKPELIRGMSKWRRFGNWLLRWLTRIASGNYKLVDPQAGYTAISSSVLRSIDLNSIYPYYGYCNDILVKLSVLKARIVEVPIPYMYRKGPSTSKIRYSRYIPKVSWLLLRLFLWRLKESYLNKSHNHRGETGNNRLETTDKKYN